MLVNVDVGRGRVSGRCDPEFSNVADAFVENFRSRDEVGASVCVSIAGETVVDLWGGRVADARRRRGMERRHDLARVLVHEERRRRCARTC